MNPGFDVETGRSIFDDIDSGLVLFDIQGVFHREGHAEVSLWLGDKDVFDAEPAEAWPAYIGDKPERQQEAEEALRFVAKSVGIGADEPFRAWIRSGDVFVMADGARTAFRFSMGEETAHERFAAAESFIESHPELARAE